MILSRKMQSARICCYCCKKKIECTRFI